MTLSKHDEDFANAMALKLRLNREARQTEARLKDEYGDFRYDIAAKCVSDHQRAGTAGPGLTIYHVLEMMERDGFYNGKDHKNFTREEGSSDLHQTVVVLTQCFRLQTPRKKKENKTTKGATKR